MGKDFKGIVASALKTRGFGACVNVHAPEHNLNRLRTATNELRDHRNNVFKRIKACEEHRNQRRLDKVQLWLSQSEAAIREAEDLIAQGSKGGGAHRLEKKLLKKAADIAALKVKGEFDVVAEAAADQVPDDNNSTIGLEQVASQVWRSVTVEPTGTIGLFGPEGVGKTTVLTQVNNKLLQHKSSGFDFVIFCVVSKNPNLEKIQDTIREKIGFLDKTWTSKTETDKAAKISEILSNKRFVLFLDDVWERVDLSKIGVPAPNPSNGSKVVFSTCLEEVCRDMGAQTKVRIERLAWEKAWELFKKNVGEDTLKSHPEIGMLAIAVAEKCEGLPLALVTIGRAMTCKKAVQEWHDALYILSNSAPNFSVLKILDRN